MFATMASALAVLTVALTITTVLAVPPSYFKNCYRDDPKFDACMVKTVEALRPNLRNGIPALAIPPLEPLKLRGLTLRHDSRFADISGKDFVIRGASDYKIEEIKSHLPNKAYVKFSFPKFKFDANYDVMVKFLNLRLKGKGMVTVYTEDITGNVTFTAHLVQKGGKKYIIVDTVDVKVGWKNYVVELGGAFFKDPAVTNIVNTALEENKQEMIDLMRPRTESLVRNILLRTANKLTKRSTYDELFPPTKPLRTK